MESSCFTLEGPLKLSVHLSEMERKKQEAKYTHWYFQTGPAELYDLFASYYIESDTQIQL